MKVLLIGERYSDNLGDGVLFETFSYICKEIYKNWIIKELDISGRIDYDNNEIWKNKLYKKLIIKLLPNFLVRTLSKYSRIRKLNKNITKINLKEINLVIFVGGALFQDYFALPIFFVIKKLSKNSIPIIFNCCGLGKKPQKIDFVLLKRAINNKYVLSISIRDNYNYFITKYLTKKNFFIEKTLDPAFELTDCFIAKKHDTQKIGIGIMQIDVIKKNIDNFNEDKYLNIIRFIITELERQNLEWEFFTNGSQYDNNYAELLCYKLKIGNKLSIRPTRPMELVNTINKYTKVISFRMHSHIISAALYIPTIGFIWDEKVREFAKMTCNNYFIDLNENIMKQMEKSLKWLLSDKANSFFPKGIKTSDYIKSLKLSKQ